MKSSHRTVRRDAPRGAGFQKSPFLWPARLLLVALGLLWLHNLDAVDGHIAELWAALRAHPLFLTPFFETGLVSVYFIVLYAGYVALTFVPGIERYYLHRPAAAAAPVEPLWRPGRSSRVAGLGLLYVVPLLALDLIKRKDYPGVDPKALRRQPLWGLQRWRELPVDPPTSLQLVGQTAAAVLLYDCAFFFIHIALHHVPALYCYHAPHHAHSRRVNWDVTNHLSVCERTGLVLLANECLKLLQAHPLSRTLFVFVFIFLLMDGHSGIDMPLGYHHITFGVFGGPLAHYTHHVHHDAHYAPFTTLLDPLAPAVIRAVRKLGGHAPASARSPGKVSASGLSSLTLQRCHRRSTLPAMTA